MIAIVNNFNEVNQYVPRINRESLKKDICDYLDKDVWLTENEYTRLFEKQLADILNVKHCHIICNGTISLSIALLACGLKKNANVVIPNLSMLATKTAVEFVGMNTFYVDVNNRGLLDLKETKHVILEKKISAVILVTLNGRIYDKKEYVDFKRFCKKNRVYIIEDNAQSMGSRGDDELPISCADIGSFSFSTPKIITTGQGGCLVTNSDELSEKIIKIRDFGRLKGGVDQVEDFGINGKFTDLQAIVGLNQLKEFNALKTYKNLTWNWYYEKLGNKPYLRMIPKKANELIWFVDIYSDRRDELILFLNNKGIGTRKMYPSFGGRDCLNSFNMSYEGLWLPSSLSISKQEINYVCENIIYFFEKKGK